MAIGNTTNNRIYTPDKIPDNNNNIHLFTIQYVVGPTIGGGQAPTTIMEQDMATKTLHPVWVVHHHKATTLRRHMTDTGLYLLILHRHSLLHLMIASTATMIDT